MGETWLRWYRWGGKLMWAFRIGMDEIDDGGNTRGAETRMDLDLV